MSASFSRVTINNKGQTPRDVATGNPVKELLYDTELELGLLNKESKFHGGGQRSCFWGRYEPK